MGMFDELKCEYPLPSHPELQGRTWQTKSFECNLEMYHITADGFLTVEKHERETVMDDNAVFGFYLKSIRQWTETLDDFHGDIFFYGFADEMYNAGWITFRARFTEGRLSNIKEVFSSAGVIA